MTVKANPNSDHAQSQVHPGVGILIHDPKWCCPVPTETLTVGFLVQKWQLLKWYLKAPPHLSVVVILASLTGPNQIILV